MLILGALEGREKLSIWIAISKDSISIVINLQIFTLFLKVAHFIAPKRLLTHLITFVNVERVLGTFRADLAHELLATFDSAFISGALKRHVALVALMKTQEHVLLSKLKCLERLLRLFFTVLRLFSVFILLNEESLSGYIFWCKGLNS